MTSRSVFVSKNSKDLYRFKQHCRINNIILHNQSLIKFKRTPFEPINQGHEVVFFSSPRCVDFFFKQGVPLGLKMACIGKATEKRLNKYSVESAFTGIGSSDSEKVFISFAQWLGDRKVLIPHGNRSSLSIFKYLKKEQAFAVEVYQTFFRKKNLPTCDIYVFSSPSNVESFFKAGNVLDVNAQIISWGKSTTSCLLSKNIIPVSELKFGLEKELINIVSKL